MFDDSFPNAGNDLKDRLNEILEKNLKKITDEDQISPVELQRHFLKFSSSSDAIDNLHKLKDYLQSKTDEFQK